MNTIEILADLLLCCFRTYLWVYDPEGRFLRTNCPDDSFLELEDFRGLNQLVQNEATEHSKPSIITGALQIAWIVDSLREDGEVKEIYALGPIFADVYPEKYLKDILDHRILPISTREKLLKQFSEISVVPFMKMTDITLMMHYAITGERISAFDLHLNIVSYQESDTEEETRSHGTYQAEKEMLRMVSEGDLRLTDYLKKMGANWTVGTLADENSEPLRQIKNTTLAAITLFARAAIEGGMYPDTALTISDRYFQAVENAKTFREVIDINYTMQNDYVNRVHKIRSHRQYSKPVSNLIDYLEIHIEDEIRMKDLADKFGYTEYYLSKKFKKETGTTVKEHLRDIRLEHAKRDLEDSSETIHEISERYRFPSQSYFTERFKEKYGVTPKGHRMGKQNN